MTQDGFEKLPLATVVNRNSFKQKAAVRNQVLNQGRVYEAQAVRAEYLLRVIDSAQATVQRRQSYITKYKKFQQIRTTSGGR